MSQRDIRQVMCSQVSQEPCGHCRVSEGQSARRCSDNRTGWTLQHSVRDGRPGQGSSRSRMNCV